MTTRNERGQPAFLASETNIGGAHQILSDYASHYRRVGEVKPTKEILQTKVQSPRTMAERLSHNRAARRAAVDRTSVEHGNNVFHLHRRIERMYSETERRKNVHDPTMYPTFQKRTHNTTRADLHESLLEPWKEGWGASMTRPGSAPTSTLRRKSPEPYQGWSVTKNLRSVFPADDFPLRYADFTAQRLMGDYAVYKKAIMEEIIKSRMYKEMDLKHLFKSYLKLAPLHDKETVEQVIADLKRELDVR